MRIIGADMIDAILTFPALVEALRDGFRGEMTVPLRHHHPLARPGSVLLLMPAWNSRHVGVKLATVFPSNPAQGLASVQATYLLLSAETGTPLASLDGTRLTLWRTAAASALAAGYLARKDASSLVMVGAGALAPYLVRAHASVRPIDNVSIWNRTPSRAEDLAERLRGEGFTARAVEDLEAACRRASIVSCATVSEEPLVYGAWLRPGTHVDLVGAFTPRHREADDETMRRASIFADTRNGVLSEAGEVVQAIASGAIGEDAIEADLFDLARGDHAGRADPGEITLFKSVGTALEDLAAADYVYDRLTAA